ncbi:MAG: M50 family metallopeptidase [Actinomycetota bacterium]
MTEWAGRQVAATFGGLQPLPIGLPEGFQSGVLDRLPEFSDMADGQLIQLFWAAVAVSLILPRLPYGRMLLYPFALLGTWVHELGHGLTAIAVGGRFKRLEVHRNLDGLAFSSGLGGLGRAIVAAGGLLAPAVVGGLFIVLGSREATAPWILTGLAAAVLLSVVLFVRNTFGWVVLGLIGLALVPLAWQAPVLIKVFVAQLVGIQFCVASWGSLNYMFTKNFVRSDGTLTDSDTQTIANVLLLPYWFWGGVIALFSLAILIASFYLAWIYPS